MNKLFCRLGVVLTMYLGSISLALASPLKATSNVKLNYLSGIERLACEAILCLSSGVTPNECNPSLSHYFDIRIFKRGVLDWPATLDARRAFLNMCPASSDVGMAGLINAISEGGGRCDAEYLNRTHKRMVRKIRRVERGGDEGDSVYVQEIQAVNDALPTYCAAYANHEWTYEMGVRYVGTPCTGGRWVEEKDYDRELAKWQSKQPAQEMQHPWQRSATEECTWADSDESRFAY